MQWKPDDTFVVNHPSAPFAYCHGKVTEVDLPFPYPVKAMVETKDGAKPCWYRLDEIEPLGAAWQTEQLPAVTG